MERLIHERRCHWNDILGCSKAGSSLRLAAEQLGSFGLPLLNSKYSSSSRLCLTAALAGGDLTECLQLTVPKGFKSLSRTQVPTPWFSLVHIPEVSWSLSLMHPLPFHQLDFSVTAGVKSCSQGGKLGIFSVLEMWRLLLQAGCWLRLADFSYVVF